MIRVAIFDDNKHILESFEILMKHTTDVSLTGKFKNCDHLEEKITESKPDVVVMDIDMPGMNGISATQVIKRKFPEIEILIQTVFDDEDKVFQALCAGATGYVLKENLGGRMEAVIREVYAGGSPMSPTIARKVISIFMKFVPQDTLAIENKYQLTPKENEVLLLLVDGLAYKMIADKLGLAYSTIHSHIKSIYRKLHVASMSEAVSKAIKENLV